MRLHRYCAQSTKCVPQGEGEEGGDVLAYGVWCGAIRVLIPATDQLSESWLHWFPNPPALPNASTGGQHDMVWPAYT